MRAVVKREGVRGLYRGVTAMAMGAGPAHAIYFATYEKAKDLYGGNRQGYQLAATAAAGECVVRKVGGLRGCVPPACSDIALVHTPHTSTPHPRAGATATVVNDACMTPWDVIKQRMQITHSPFKNIMECARTTWRNEGIAAFYRSYWTTVCVCGWREREKERERGVIFLANMNGYLCRAYDASHASYASLPPFHPYSCS